METKNITNFSTQSQLFQQLKDKNNLTDITFQVTRRCNNNCRHCNLNFPANDAFSKKKELPASEIKALIDQAVSSGVIFCALTGGEPLIREDFFDLYTYIRKKGVFPTLLTNATLIDERHIELFKQYPPRAIEVTVYGVTKGTYERVSRIEGSFERFHRGVNLLLENKIKVELKAMVLSSNLHEWKDIKKFCQREISDDQLRGDPFVFLNNSYNDLKNSEIAKERLTPEEFVDWEKRFCPECIEFVQENYCGDKVYSKFVQKGFLSCAEKYDCTISYDGRLLFCQYLTHPDYSFDLKKLSLKDAVETLYSKIKRDFLYDREHFSVCKECKVKNFCIRCPGRCYVETGNLDSPPEYLCQIAYARASAFGAKI